MAGDTEAESADAKKPAVKTFSCTSCGAPVSVKAAGQTVAVGCPSCGAVIDVTDDNYRIISEAQKKILFYPAIPLGKRGTIRGEKWEVIGFMVRSDGSGVYSWREYLLWNPFKGFRWLTEYNGHWNYVITTRKNPHANKDSAFYLGRTYKLYSRGEAKVIFVLGEFYWRVQVGETVNVEDYIDPPGILSREVSAQEEIWSIGEYIEPDAIYAAFKPDNPLPTMIGIAPNQPSLTGEATSAVWKRAWIFIGILFVIHIATMVLSGHQLVYHNGFTLMKDTAMDKFVTPPFAVKGGASNLEFTLESPVDNSWIDLDIDLVNEGTGEVREISHGVEYYHGRDSDGPWAEGDQKKSALLSDMPDGTYHMNVDSTVATAPTQKSSAPQPPRVRFFELSVKRGVVTWSAFVLSILAVLAYPLIVWARRESFEVKRWEESDFSPYQTDD
jgi:predicted RNA-binding Zn-ribbon protein involved in translation (DUF1610 family)